jgi:hypothetical protein
VILDVPLLASVFFLGLATQRRCPGETLPRGAWTPYFWTLSPTLVFGRSPLALAAGFPNTGFVGYPLARSRR